jgi:hypothetical protein
MTGSGYASNIVGCADNIQNVTTKRYGSFKLICYSYTGSVADSLLLVAFFGELEGEKGEV